MTEIDTGLKQLTGLVCPTLTYKFSCDLYLIFKGSNIMTHNYLYHSTLYLVSVLFLE